MDNNALYFQKKLEDFEEVIWNAKQHFKNHQNYRADIRSAWDDKASREINQRYLDPNSDISEEFLKELLYQYDLMISIANNVSKINNIFLEANQLSQKIETLQNSIDRDVSDAAINYDTSNEYFSNAEQKINEAINLIRAANKIS